MNPEKQAPSYSATVRRSRERIGIPHLILFATGVYEAPGRFLVSPFVREAIFLDRLNRQHSPCVSSVAGLASWRFPVPPARPGQNEALTPWLDGLEFWSMAKRRIETGC
jgi:hypothetical protein